MHASPRATLQDGPLDAHKLVKKDARNIYGRADFKSLKNMQSLAMVTIQYCSLLMT
jgi:hypothetical protein